VFENGALTTSFVGLVYQKVGKFVPLVSFDVTGIGELKVYSFQVSGSGPADVTPITYALTGSQQTITVDGLSPGFSFQFYG
jgi:hypothetical protein